MTNTKTILNKNESFDSASKLSSSSRRSFSGAHKLSPSKKTNSGSGSVLQKQTQSKKKK